jgi:hypothetical protein
MTTLFGWCLPADAHHVNDGLPGECPGVSASGSKCSCPCHEDPLWEPAPPFRRKRLPKVVFDDDDVPEPIEESVPA